MTLAKGENLADTKLVHGGVLGHIPCSSNRGEVKFRYKDPASPCNTLLFLDTGFRRCSCLPTWIFGEY